MRDEVAIHFLVDKVRVICAVREVIGVLNAGVIDPPIQARVLRRNGRNQPAPIRVARDVTQQGNNGCVATTRRRQLLLAATADDDGIVALSRKRLRGPPQSTRMDECPSIEQSTAQSR